MARKSHWLSAIANEVRERAFEMVDTVAAGLLDTVPFGEPEPPPPQLRLEHYLSASPEQRQAMLQGLPAEEFSSTMSRLYDEAVNRFGPMASAITPMLMMEGAQGDIARATQESPETGVVAAHAELTELLGFDPFSR